MLSSHIKRLRILAAYLIGGRRSPEMAEHLWRAKEEGIISYLFK